MDAAHGTPISGTGASAFFCFWFSNSGLKVLFGAPLAASGGGHTLHCCDLRIILALEENGICDGGHSVDVMN